MRLIGVLALVALVPAVAHAQPASLARAGGTPLSQAELIAMLGRPLTLDDCIRIGLERNLTLRQVEGESDKAESAHFGTTGRFMPILSFGAGLTDTRQIVADTVEVGGVSTLLENNTMVAGIEQFLPIGTHIVVTNNVTGALNSTDRFLPPERTRLRAVSGTITQPLLRGGGFAAVAPVQAAKIFSDAREKDLRSAERTTVLAVKTAYFAALRDRALISVARTAVANDSLLVDASETMIKAQMATRRDILSAQLRQADDKTTLAGAQRDFALSLDGLKEELGVPLSQEIALAESAFPDTTLEFDEESLVQDALRMHPDIQSAEAMVKFREVNVKFADNGRLPQVNLVGTYSRTYDSLLDTFQDTHKTEWLGSLQVSLPLFNRDARANADIARSSLDQERARLELVKIQTQRAVRQALRTLQSLAEERRSIHSLIALAQEKVQFATAMFNLGRASNFDITDAQKDLIKGQNDSVRKLADYYAQIAILENLTGRDLMP